MSKLNLKKKKPEDSPVFLKCIQIQGFKSFADRVKLELDKGLSVVVGPNGSGKSNVADAVRWVLGEQSAKSLRGAKMEDVIFAGSVQRRPVGMAEVSLIFDNSTGLFPLDFREITIARRVYRDGDGQYLINNAACRLKDIQELFMDTGAGKEGFSIIGQGRVEEILNLKAEERRSLIDEAAGITKFRYRKKEALKRLEATGLNLQRLDDILQEIEGRLTPLAVQAQVAEQSLALAAEQRGLEIQLTVLDIAEGKQKLAKAAEEAEKLQADLSARQAQFRLKESESSEITVRLKELEEDLQKRQSEAFQAEQKKDALKHELSIRAERGKYLEEQIARLNEEIRVEEEKMRLLEEQLETLAARQAVLKYTVREAGEKVLAREQELKLARENNLEQEIERLKTDLFQALAEQANWSNQRTEVKQNLESLGQQIRQLTEEHVLKDEERQDLARGQEELARELEKLAEQIRFREAERAELKTEAERLRRLRQEKNAERQKLKTRQEQAAARRQALQSLEDSWEGYQRGVREVMLARKRKAAECVRLCGTVAELITVREEYELAVETALGSGLQNVVAESEEAAKQAIAYLKTHQFGRVTFLPLDVIQGSRLSVSPIITRDPGYIGLAVDLAEYDPLYKPALEFMLGRIVVVTDLAAATRIAKTSGYKLRIVTLEGDQVHPGGSLSGGSVQRKGGSLLARSRLMEDLRVVLRQLDEELLQTEKVCAELDLLREKQQEKEESLSIHWREDQERQVKLKALQESGLKQLKRLEEDQRHLTSRRQEKLTEREELDRQWQSVSKEWEKAEETALKLREEFRQREQDAKNISGEIEAFIEELTGEKISLAKWEQELEQCGEQLKTEQGVYQEKEASLGCKKQDREKLQGDCKDLEEEQKALTEQVERQAQDLEIRQYALLQRRQEKEGVEARSREIEEEIQAGRQLKHGLEQRLHANELRVVRFETECRAGEARLAEEFNLTCEEALPYQGQEERATLWRKVQALKQQVEELGPINQAAIEEYPKMQARKDFMLAQQTDLVKAEQTLRQVISELDKTMSKRFGESFLAVNAAFQEVFQDLFQGGQAELQLTDPDNMLETGVEIIAQPPGKKPQLLSLLSGGERALTAIALLFALLRVKPSPFCILDEIEASLDDANIQRFAKYIHRLSESTQFVVISHRKGTMESADILYGITMEESGVSKLLSVQLGDRSEEPYSA